MTKLMTPADIKRVVEILDPRDSEYGVTYEIHPEDKLSKCGIFVPSLIDTVELLARELAVAYGGNTDVYYEPEPIAQQWIEWARKDGEL
jgi:hypothetical protein